MLDNKRSKSKDKSREEKRKEKEERRKEKERKKKEKEERRAKEREERRIRRQMRPKKDPLPEEIRGDELLAKPDSVVRLDVLFSFGLLTSSDRPVFTNYMDAVERIVLRTCDKTPTLTGRVRYDSVYPPYVQEYKTDGKLW